MAKHTSGPWEWSAADKWSLLLHQAGQTWVDNSILQCDRCDSCVKHDPAERKEKFKCAWPSKADAALIAAAPDLLAACITALALLTGTGQDGTLGHHPDNPVPAMLAAAIAKAKGE